MNAVRDALAFDVVVPTIGRLSLRPMLDALEASEGPRPCHVVLADDRRGVASPLDVPRGSWVSERLVTIRSAGRGPAAARNAGWRAGDAPWVAFVDDDVLPPGDWLTRLAADLASCGPADGGVAARIRVPRAAGRRPTDWERNVGGLERARWATADMAYRREALLRVGGFDERFPRAYREDADLALRVRRAGYSLRAGEREMTHPVRPADRWVSVRLQAGNADDALMRALHGRRWRDAAEVPSGARAQHVATTAAALAAVAALLAGRRRLAALAGIGWAGSTARFVAKRIAPGPRTADEIGTMLLTSVAIPPAATYHWTRGVARARSLAHGPGPAGDEPRPTLRDREAA